MNLNGISVNIRHNAPSALAVAIVPLINNKTIALRFGTCLMTWVSREQRAKE